MILWADCVAALDKEEGDDKFVALLATIGERPTVSETPPEHNDPLGETRY